MTVGTLDRKTAILAVSGVAAILLLRLVLGNNSAPAVVGTTESVPQALARLEKLRRVAATVPGKEDLMKQAAAELQAREKGMLKADTAAQSLAHLQEILNRVGRANGVDIRGVEEARMKVAGDYGSALVTVRFSCTIDQLVNLVAALAGEPELIATEELQVTGSTDKNKVIQVRLTLAGIVPKKLAQEKKTGSTL
jgi:hypothetical protein